jgi:uncharacterized phage-like protein YoqJ
MKKGKYSITVSSDSEDTLKQFHSFMVNDAEQQCLIYDKDGEESFYPEIKWNIKNRKDLDLTINCDFKHKVD